jgi:hypothetical protein
VLTFVPPTLISIAAAGRAVLIKSAADAARTKTFPLWSILNLLTKTCPLSV